MLMLTLMLVIVSLVLLAVLLVLILAATSNRDPAVAVCAPPLSFSSQDAKPL